MNIKFPFYVNSANHDGDPTLIHFKPGYNHDDVHNNKCHKSYFMYIETFDYKNHHWPTFLTPSNSAIEAGNCIIDDKCELFVDVGANCGMTSYFAYLRGAKRIISFEPSPKEAKAYLMNNIPNTTLYTFGVSNKVGFSKLPTTYGFEEGVESLTYTVTMDYLFEQNVFNHIDFLKIDIEGHEYEFFQGLNDKNLSKIKNISIEIHGPDSLRDNPKLGHLFKEHLKKRLWAAPYFDGTSYKNRIILELFVGDRIFLWSHI